MFYWDTETSLFHENGGRKDRQMLMQDAPGGNFNMSFTKFGQWISQKEAPLNETTKDRKNYYDRGNGNYVNAGSGNAKGKMHVALIKPYMVSAFTDHENGGAQHFPMDKFRVFGKAISNAQPFEMVDIMLSRQAI
jgi:hypothetical protein